MENRTELATHLHSYFVQVAEIWAAFNQKGMSVQQREYLLAPYRKIVGSLPTSGFNA